MCNISGAYTCGFSSTVYTLKEGVREEMFKMRYFVFSRDTHTLLSVSDF